MTYVALLRGINVGGNNKVDMKQLKSVFEKTGIRSVSTYINTGNVIFVDDEHEPEELTPKLEEAIEKAFGFSVKVLVRDIDNFRNVIKALPDSWRNDEEMKCDIMFLWEELDSPHVMNKIDIKAGVDDVRYVDGALLWSVARQDTTQSGMMKLVGTKPYKQMTIRNCNTVRKLLEKMEQVEV